MTAPDPLGHYRHLMHRIGEQDEVALIDQHVAELWSGVVALAAPDLDRDGADVPTVVAIDLDAPADLDIRGCLDKVARILDPGQAVRSRSPFTDPKVVAQVWLGVCVLCAVALGVTVRGVVVIPAFVPAIAAGALALAFGVGRLPGFVWSIGLLPLALLFVSGEPPSDTTLGDVPPQWYVAVVFLVVVEGFAYLLRLLGWRDLHRRSAAGRPASDRHVLRTMRRPLEVSLVACTVAATFSADPDGLLGLLLVACLAGLLWRRRWTTALAAAFCVLHLALDTPADSMWGDNWAQSILLAALLVHWTRALFSTAWQERLAITEAVLHTTGRAAHGVYGTMARVIDAQVVAPILSTSPMARPQPAPAPAPAPAPQKTYPEGQFPRYCNSCLGSTPHIRGNGLSQPICVQCGSKATGAGYRERTVTRYCGSCGGATPHTSKGCTACATSGRGAWS